MNGVKILANLTVLAKKKREREKDFILQVILKPRNGMVRVNYI